MSTQNKCCDSTSAAATRSRDPVCGMEVDPATAISLRSSGVEYYFCCQGCKDKFDAEPARYPAQTSPLRLTTAQDLVCGMQVDPTTSPSLTHDDNEYFFCCQGCKTKFAAAPDEYLRTTDPVCGMRVDPSTAASLVQDGSEYFFCCDGCRNKFAADPDQYLGGDKPQPPAAAPGSTYICPMCPEVESPVAADCPSCGMALEPAVPMIATTRTGASYRPVRGWAVPPPRSLPAPAPSHI